MLVEHYSGLEVEFERDEGRTGELNVVVANSGTMLYSKVKGDGRYTYRKDPLILSRLKECIEASLAVSSLKAN